MRRVALFMLLGFLPHVEAADSTYADRWVYCSQNLLVDKNADELIALIQRAAKAGFNGVVVADYKFNILGRMPKRYFTNVERVKQAASDARIEIIPTLFPIGYSDGILAHDPNLAEGLPVKNAPFVARSGHVEPAAEQPKFINGDLELTRGDRFLQFTYQDDPGVSTFADRAVHHGGKVSCRMQDTKSNCRLVQRVKVRPWSCYRFSCWIKTRDLEQDGFKLMALPASKGGRALTFHEAQVKPTQDWTEIDIVFNSLEETEISLFVGVWSGLKGKMWIDDLKFEELHLVNLLRRDALPLAVTSADGQTVYEEGKDFHPIRDQKLMQAPGGGFEFRHAGPVIRLTAQSRIQEGERLLVSWYHPVIIHWDQNTCSLVDPRVFEILKDQAKRVYDLFKPKTVFMSHDEIRVAGWCKLAEKSGKTPGQMLADNVRECVKILRAVSPQVRIAVWSDMFDPNHNAVDRFYLANGSMKGSWEGLPKEVIVVNWNGGKASASLKWFADRGHTQIIAGYYDGDIKNFERWHEAAKGVPGVHGFMYTTWKKKYTHLEEYGKALSR